MNEPSEREIFWRDYALNAQLYQFYLDATIKANIFYYGITGGILSFCLTQQQWTTYTPWAFWALVLPILMSICFALIFFYSSFLAKTLNEDTAELADRLGLLTHHEFSSLILVLRVFAVLHVVCAIAIVYLLWKVSPNI